MAAKFVAHARLSFTRKPAPLLLSSVLGRALPWEPDFALMVRGSDDFFHLAGGAVCFPSSWALREKLGKPLDLVHAPVPGINPALARAFESAFSDLSILIGRPLSPTPADFLRQPGIMEIGDVFVVNKMDRPGADRTKAEIEYALDLGYALSRRPKVLMTNAETSEGVDELVAEVDDYHAWLSETGLLAKRRIRHAELVVSRILADRLMKKLSSEGEGGKTAHEQYLRVAERQATPFEAAHSLFEAVIDKGE